MVPAVEQFGVSEHKGIPVVSSRKVAEVFDKRHDHLLKSIRELIRKVNIVRPSFARENFFRSEYMSRGKVYQHFLLSQDGFTMLCMGFTGENPIDKKLDLVSKEFDAFHMRNRLKSGVSV
jgi:Rha family phage regulatory protein